MEKDKCYLAEKIGNVIYVVNALSSESAKKTKEEKIKEMIEKEAMSGKFKNEKPQST